MTALFQARLQLDERLTPAELAGFETVFSELLDAAATAHLRDGGGDWLIEALFTDPPAEDAVAALLAPVFADCGLTPVPVAITPLAQRDWLAENRAAFPPRRIGRFWIYGSHVETPPPPTSWPLLVEAAQAFGSGTHPTTEGCLRVAEAILRQAAVGGENELLAIRIKEPLDAAGWTTGAVFEALRLGERRGRLGCQPAADVQDPLRDTWWLRPEAQEEPLAMDEEEPAAECEVGGAGAEVAQLYLTYPAAAGERNRHARDERRERAAPRRRRQRRPVMPDGLTALGAGLRWRRWLRCW